MSAKKVRPSLRRLDKAAILQLLHQLEALEAEIKSSNFKLNRRIKRIMTGIEDYEFKIKMLRREKAQNAEYMISRYNQEIEKNTQETKELEGYAGKLRMLLRENEILKKDLTNEGTNLETVRGEMTKLREMHRELMAKTTSLDD